MFLIGGAAYSGTTLLALMLNQNGVTCLNEPDFHDPDQSHNGIPVLQKLYPCLVFPPRTDERLSLREAFELMQTCQRLVQPNQLGVKFCNRPFLDFARLFRDAGLPVVAIIRDVRDALVRPLLPYVGGERGLIQRYREIWQSRDIYDEIVRYEELVTNPSQVVRSISSIIGCPLQTRDTWHPDDVLPSMMYPRYRHYLLKSGRVTGDRVGIWQTSGKQLDPDAHDLAGEMGYL